MDVAAAQLAAHLLDGLDSPPLSSACWSEGASIVEFVWITPQLSLVSSRGPGHSGSRSFYQEHAPKVCDHAGSVIFWDLGALTSTDLGVVSTCLGIGKANRHNVSEVHMFYASAMVGMAVTVGNVALNGLIRLYREAEPFAEAFKTAVAESRAQSRARA